MSEFCNKRDVPINDDKLVKSHNFKENKDKTGIIGNVDFLNNIKEKLKAYSFHGGPALIYHEEKAKPLKDPFTGKLDDKNIQDNIQEKSKNYSIKFLRYHYLHWNATYGDPRKLLEHLFQEKIIPIW